MVEGSSEVVLLDSVRRFLKERLPNRMPQLKPEPRDGRIPTGAKLKHEVTLLLQDFDFVIALTDVYTGTDEFKDAADAKGKMRAWVGSEDRFFPHAAQHDLEAWLLPFWNTIQQVSGSARTRPSSDPESVNHSKPPSQHLKETFLTGRKKKAYVKTRDALRILKDADLAVAAAQCPELKAFLNTILRLCDGPVL